MEVTIAKDQPMEYLPRVKSIFKEGVYRYDFMVKCRPQNVITTEEENPAVKSIIRKLGALSGSIRVFMGPSNYFTEQNEYLCGLWIQDLGAFLKKVFKIVEEDRAELIVSVKHHGRQIGGRDFSVRLSRDSSNPTTRVKCGAMGVIGPRPGRHGFDEFFDNVTSGSFAVTMVLKFEA